MTVFWILLAALFVFYIFPMFFFSWAIYFILFVRWPKTKWQRECSMPNDPEIKEMFDIGMKWAEDNEAYKKEVRTKSGKLNLAGEYFDFGNDKAVIILAGRTETLLYSYYFAEPYKDSGYNVLVIDNRAHGLSDGKRGTIGKMEAVDIRAWGKMLHEEFGVNSIVLHGICIGSSAAVNVFTEPECPDYFTAIVAEGMYVTFYESFKNHMIEGKHPNFPLTYLCMMYIRLLSHVNVVSDGPIYRIDRMKKPVLFMQSREDNYSLPEKAELLYNKCGASVKKLVYFDKGAHSHIKINAPEKYDETIKEFLNVLS